MNAPEIDWFRAYHALAFRYGWTFDRIARIPPATILALLGDVR